MRLTALERTRDLPTPRLTHLPFKTWVGGRWFTRHRTPTTTPTPA